MRYTSTVLLAWVLLLALATPASSSSCDMNPENVTHKDNHVNTNDDVTWASPPLLGSYLNIIFHYSNDLSLAYFNYVSTFISSLFWGDFPYDAVADFEASGDDIRKLVMYAVGFALCLLVGILFVLVTPFYGLCWCCCRCMGKCGGERVWRPEDERNSKRNCLCLGFLIFVMLICASIGAFKVVITVDDIDEALSDTGPNTIAGAVSDVATFVNNTANEWDFYFGDRYEFINKVMQRDLLNVGNLLGKAIQDELENAYGFLTLINKLKNFIATYTQIEDDIKAVEQARLGLQTTVSDLKVALDQCKDAFQEVVDNGTMCTVLDCPAIQAYINTSQINIDPSQMPSIHPTSIMSALGYTTCVGGVADWYDTICDEVTTQTEQARNATLAEMNASLQVVTNAIDAAHDAAKQVTDKVNDIEAAIDTSTLWHQMVPVEPLVVGVALAGLVVIIVLIAMCGVCCGCLGYDEKNHPTERTSLSNCGGVTMLCSACCFYGCTWVLMIVVVVLFAGLGGIYGLGCTQLADEDLTFLEKLVDDPNAMFSSTVNLNNMFNNQSIIQANLKLSEILKGCRDDKPLASLLLDLQEVNTSLMGFNKMTAFRQAEFHASVDLERNIGVSGDCVLVALGSMESGSSWILSQLPNYWPQVEQSVIHGNDSEPSDIAAALADNITYDSNWSPVLLNIAIKLNATVQTTLDKARQQRDDLKAAVNSLNTTLHSNAPVMSSLRQDLLDISGNFSTNFNQTVTEMMDKYMVRLYEVVKKFADGVVNTMTSSLARCFPIWQLYDHLVVQVLCDGFILEVCGIWFGLGGCLFFLSLAMCCIVPLTKHFLKMKEAEQFSKPKRTRVQPARDQTRVEEFQFDHPPHHKRHHWQEGYP